MNSKLLCRLFSTWGEFFIDVNEARPRMSITIYKREKRVPLWSMSCLSNARICRRQNHWFAKKRKTQKGQQLNSPPINPSLNSPQTSICLMSKQISLIYWMDWCRRKNWNTKWKLSWDWRGIKSHQPFLRTLFNL